MLGLLTQKPLDSLKNPSVRLPHLRESKRR